MKLSFWRSAKSLIIALMLAMIAALSLEPDRALAHASLLDTDPPDGAVLARSPETITLRFNEPVSPLVVTIVGPDGASGSGAAVSAINESVEIRPSAPLPTGSSLVSYRIISADGHPVSGSLTISVGRPTNAAGSSEASGNQSVNALIWLTRIGLYLALFVGVGGGFFRVWVVGSAGAPTWADRNTTGLILSGLPLAVAVFSLQGLDALGLPLSAFFDASVWQASWSTSYASTLLAAVLAMLLALASQRCGRIEITRSLSAAALLGVGLALAASGHASAGQPQALMRPAVFVHGVAIAFWAGAILPLIALATEDRIEFAAVLRRFAGLATLPVALLAATGAILASVQLEQISSLWTTRYGLVLCAKLLCVSPLLALAGLNRLRLTPAIERASSAATRQLVWSMRAEFVLMLAIFSLAAAWRFTPPPRALLQASAQPVRLHIHTEKAMVDVTLTPGHAGPVTAKLYFQSGDFGPLTPKEVTLSFARPEAGIEQIERKAEPGPDGFWTSGPFFLPQAGDWTLRIDALISDFDKVILQDRIEIRH